MAGAALRSPTDVLQVQARLEKFFTVARDDLRDRADRGLFTPDATPAAWDAWQALKPRVAKFLALAPSWKTADKAFADGAGLVVEIMRFSDRMGGVKVGAGIIYTWTDMQELQKAIASDYQVLDNAVQTCNAAQPGGQRGAGQLDDQTLADWIVMQGRVAAFVREDSSVISLDTQVEAGKALQTDLAAWHDRLKAAGCTVAAAPTIPKEGFSFGELGRSFSQLISSPVALALLFLVLFEAKK